MSKKSYDYRKKGSSFYTFSNPPKINKEAIEVFSEDLIPIVEEKLHELLDRKEEIDKRHKDLSKAIDFAVEQGMDGFSEWFWSYYDACLHFERFYVISWITYWVNIWEVVKKQRVFNTEEIDLSKELDLEKAKQYPIEELFEGDLRKIGSRFIGSCPFHEEKTPSFIIFTKSNRFYCFGCSEGGDSLAFLQKQEDISFLQAVERLTR